jgi:hypothetical protein
MVNMEETNNDSDGVYSNIVIMVVKIMSTRLLNQIYNQGKDKMKALQIQ